MHMLSTQCPCCMLYSLCMLSWYVCCVCCHVLWYPSLLGQWRYAAPFVPAATWQAAIVLSNYHRPLFRRPTHMWTFPPRLHAHSAIIIIICNHHKGRLHKKKSGKSLVFCQTGYVQDCRFHAQDCRYYAQDCGCYAQDFFMIFLYIYIYYIL